MSITSRFPPTQLDAFAAAPVVGMRAGRRHRFTAVWVVVVERRVFVRSWGGKESGWYHALRAAPDAGWASLQGKTMRIGVRHVRSERLRAAVSAAYGMKYPTPGSAKWVRGFAEAEREQHTLELMPR